MASIFTIKKAAKKLLGEELLKEYLTDEQRKKYSKWKMSNKARKDTDHFFGPGVDLKKEAIKGYDGDKSEVHKAIERHIGKEITHDEYKKGLTKDKYNRPVRLGRVIKDENLRTEFAKDNTRAGAKKGNGHYATIVRGVEVAGQTNSSPDEHHPRGHSWGEISCKNIDDGSNREYLEHEIEHGTTVVRVHDHNHQEIYRATLQPHHNDEGHVAYNVESEYGIKHDSFTKHAHDVAKRLSGEHKGGSPFYTKHPDVYDDTGKDTILHPTINPEKVLSDKSTKAEYLNHFAHRDNKPEHIRAALAHPNADDETATLAASNRDHPSIAMAGLNHPKADSHTTHAAARSPDIDVAMAALNHPKADFNTTHVATWRGDEKLSDAALNHPKANIDTLKYAAENHNAPIAAIKALHNPEANENVVRYGARNQNPGVSQIALKHPKATKEALSDAARIHHNSSAVSSAILNHPLVDHDHIMRMAERTTSQTIGREILKHPKIMTVGPFNKSTHVVNALMDNPNMHNLGLEILNHPQSNHTTTELGVRSVHKNVALAALNHRSAYYETAYKASRSFDPEIAKAGLNSQHAMASAYLSARGHHDKSVRDLAMKKLKEAGIQEEKTMSIVESVKRAAKSAKKKKMSKQDEKLVKDFEDREKAEKGYDQDAIRYGMKESTSFDHEKYDKNILDKVKSPNASLTDLMNGVKNSRPGIALAALKHKNGKQEPTNMPRYSEYEGSIADVAAKHEDSEVAIAALKHPVANEFTALIAAHHKNPTVVMSAVKSKHASEDVLHTAIDRHKSNNSYSSNYIVKSAIAKLKNIKNKEDVFEQSVYDAKPKQKTDVEVTRRTDGKNTNYTYAMRGRRLGDSNLAHREFARIRIGDIELNKKENPGLKEEKEITSKIVKGIVHINGKPLNHSSVEVDGVDKRDYPDFADAYVSRAEFKNGSELSDEELEHLHMHHPEVAHEAAHESIRGGYTKLRENIIQVMEAKKAKGTPKDQADPCWSGYTQYGMKMKKGRSVPNCVKDK